MKKNERVFSWFFVLGLLGSLAISLKFPQAKECPDNLFLLAVVCFIGILPLVFFRVFWLWSYIKDNDYWTVVASVAYCYLGLSTSSWFVPMSDWRSQLVGFVLFIGFALAGFIYYRRHNQTQVEEEIDCPE